MHGAEIKPFHNLRSRQDFTRALLYLLCLYVFTARYTNVRSQQSLNFVLTAVSLPFQGADSPHAVKKLLSLSEQSKARKSNHNIQNGVNGSGSQPL
jgi:hypothetical protein